MYTHTYVHTDTYTHWGGDTHPPETLFKYNLKLKKPTASTETTFESQNRTLSVSDAYFFPEVKMDSFSVKGWEKLRDVTEGQS